MWNCREPLPVFYTNWYSLICIFPDNFHTTQLFLGFRCHQNLLSSTQSPTHTATLLKLCFMKLIKSFRWPCRWESKVTSMWNTHWEWQLPFIFLKNQLSSLKDWNNPKWIVLWISESKIPEKRIIIVTSASNGRNWKLWVRGTQKSTDSQCFDIWLWKKHVLCRADTYFQSRC